MTIDYKNLYKAIKQTLITLIAVSIVTLLIIVTRGILLIVMLLALAVYSFYIRNKTDDNMNNN